jgi:hypothetical protein
MNIRFTFMAAGAALALTASTALAQPAVATTISATGGVASGASETGGAFGGSVDIGPTPWISFEGQGTYLDRGDGVDAFSAAASALVNLLRSDRPVVPYGAIGGGIYHASYDLGNPRYLGAAGDEFDAGSTICPAAGSGFGPGPGPGLGLGLGNGTCAADAGGYWGVGDLPNFYARRLGALQFPGNGIWGTRDFTDPALSVGGGVRINVTDHFVLRPDARALILFADGETETLGVFVMNVGYRF